MVKIALQIKANLENIASLHCRTANFSYLLKLKCTNCGEATDKFHPVNEMEEVESGRAVVNFCMKCKFCGREGSLLVLKDYFAEYFSSDDNAYKTIAAFDCRGLELLEFNAGGDYWCAQVENSPTTFTNVDLEGNEWVDYDEHIKESVGVYELQSQFVKIN